MPDNSYVGPTHTCAGPGCEGEEHRAGDTDVVIEAKNIPEAGRLKYADGYEDGYEDGVEDNRQDCAEHGCMYCQEKLK